MTSAAAAHRRRRRRPRHLRGEQGSSAIELVLITPVLIALVFGLVQTALVWNAQHTVAAAAQHGARLARTATALQPSISTAAVDTSSDEAVRTSTLAFLRQTGGAGLTDPTVTVRHDGIYVTVTVTGKTLGVLPGSTAQVSGSSRTPVEAFRP